MYLANCSLNLGSGPVVEGDVIEAAGANFGPWVSLGKITELSDRAVANILRAAMPGEGVIGDEETIEGSDIQPSLIEWDTGEGLPLGDLVCAAFERSGLSVAAWNALPGATTETLIWAEFQLADGPVPKLLAFDTGDSPVPDEPPEGEHFVFDPAIHWLKYRGSVAGYWVTDLDGENVQRVTKEVYGRLKVAGEKNKVAYVAAAEAFEGDAGTVAPTEDEGAQAAGTGGEGAQA